MTYFAPSGPVVLPAGEFQFRIPEVGDLFIDDQLIESGSGRSFHPHLKGRHR
jgi:hypothetical protein